MYATNDSSLLSKPLPLSITKKAEEKIGLLLQKYSGESFFRVSVTGGGCSGFQYHFSFDDVITADDLKMQQADARLVIDEVSLNLLSGSEIDYEEELGGAKFVINNPQAASTCGCGSSFSL